MREWDKFIHRLAWTIFILGMAAGGFMAWTVIGVLFGR